MSHSEYASGIRMSFWKRVDERRSVAAMSQDEAHYVEIGTTYPTLQFELPSQRYEFDKLKDMLAIAFRNGQGAAKAEIQKALGL